MNWFAELMVLGFISLLLTFGQNYISKVCIPMKYGRTMLPCLPMHERPAGHPTEQALEPHSTDHEPPAAEHEPTTTGEHEPTPTKPAGEGEPKGEHHRRLLSFERRVLSGGGGGPGCKPVINLTLYPIPCKRTVGEKQICC